MEYEGKQLSPDKTIIVAEDIDLPIWTSFGLEMGLVQAIANVEVFAMTSTVAVVVQRRKE